MKELGTDPAAGESSPAAPRPRRPVRVAIDGLSRSGILHAAVLSSIPEVELAAVSDARATARRNLRGLGFRAAAYDRAEKLIAKEKPDALVVCGAHEQRADATRTALEAGVAVLIERPFLRGRSEAEEMARLAAERGVPLACAHPLLHHPVFAAARRALHAEALGAVLKVQASMFASWVFSTQQKLEHAPPGAPGGVAAQPASDLLFLLIETLGLPAEVRATCNRIYGELEDEMHASMTLESGTEIGFDTSWSVPGYPHPATVIEVEGMNGKLLASHDALEVELFDARGGFPAGSTRLRHADLPALGRFDLHGDALYLEDATFLAWVTGGEPPLARADRAAAVARLLEALYESARRGGEPVAVAS